MVPPLYQTFSFKTKVKDIEKIARGFLNTSYLHACRCIKTQISFRIYSELNDQLCKRWAGPYECERGSHLTAQYHLSLRYHQTNPAGLDHTGSVGSFNSLIASILQNYLQKNFFNLSIQGFLTLHRRLDTVPPTSCRLGPLQKLVLYLIHGKYGYFDPTLRVKKHAHYSSVLPNGATPEKLKIFLSRRKKRRAYKC